MSSTSHIPAAHPQILLVTGPLGSGKGYAAREVVRLCVAAGWRCLRVDLDQLSRDVFARSPLVVGAVEDRCGRGVVCGGSVDRSALADRVFADPEELRWLESVTHPAIARALGSVIEQAGVEAYDLVVIEAPLPLQASPARAEFAAALRGAVVVAVQADSELRERLAEIRGDDRPDVQRRIASQPDQALYNASANAVIVNHGDPDGFLSRVREVVGPLLGIQVTEA